MVIGLIYLKNKAYNLVEIFVVVAIIGLTLSIAYSSFITYLLRAKVTAAVKVLDAYEQIAIGLRARYGTISPYYILFTDNDASGYLSGTTTGTSAVKEVDLNYILTISADSGTDSGNKYILLGAGLQHDGKIVSGADHIYVVGIESSTGVLTWQCGSSASKGDTVAAEFLPEECQNTLP